jgi:hypothetical protein
VSSFAARTKVPTEQSRNEIERTLKKYGADQFGYAMSDEHSMVGFRAKNRMIRFMLPMPDKAKFRSSDARAQETRRRWRALLLSIKAKLEAVQSGISEFDEEFMAHIVMPDNRTVAEHSLPHIVQAYETGKVPLLLPNFGPPS